ncbi:MAG: hypothetical protein ACE5FI_16900 [Anaerolineales bacterium]
MFRKILFTIALTAILLTACSAEGLGGYARNSEWLDLINADGLFTISRNGANIHFISADVNPNYPAVFVNNGDTVVWVDRFGRLQSAPTIGGQTVQISPERATTAGGTLVGLPSGHVLYMDARRFDGDRFLRVIDPISTETLVSIEGIGHVFIADAAIQERPGEPEPRWYVPFLEPGQLKIVLQSADAPDTLFLCTANATAFECDVSNPLPRVLTEADQALLDTRVPNDLRSGTLTADGRRLILRAQNAGPPAASGEAPNPPTYSLWAIDLDSNAGPIEIVARASVTPDYSVSPTDHRIAFEAVGGLLGLYDFDTGEVTTLAADAWDPDWR